MAISAALDAYGPLHSVRLSPKSVGSNIPVNQKLSLAQLLQLETLYFRTRDEQKNCLLLVQ